MKRRQRVILYGKSVILVTVGASLVHFPELEVVELSPPLPGTEDLAALAPDAILFDVNAGHPDAAFDLLKQCQNLLLISVNAENDQLLLWSSGQGSAASMGEIVRVISQFRK